MTPFISEWLREVVADAIIANGDPRAEARENQWSFTMSPEQAASTTQEDLASFVEEIIQIKRLELSRRHLPRMLFYLWFDEMSGRLCFSITSQIDSEKLDFNCDVAPDATPGDILSSFLTSMYLAGIPFDDLTDSCRDENSEADTSTSALDVFVSVL